jgi:hypothetical protein
MLITVAVRVDDDDLPAPKTSAPPMPVAHLIPSQWLERNEPAVADRRSEFGGYRGVGQVASALRQFRRHGARRDHVRRTVLELAGTDASLQVT